MEDDYAGGGAARDAREGETARARNERSSDDSATETGPRLAAHAPLLVPGTTCWRIETADRIGVIVDTADYFDALRSAIMAAQHHVFIIGWDVDSRTRLTADKRSQDGMPATLLPFLRAALRRNPELHIYIVAWDYSVVYALEREFLPSLVFSHAHPRLHFVLDNVHAVGASHHQKLVVVDDCLAFSGGIDLTIRRWDRAAHALDDAQRVDPDGQPYAPMHDLQMCVDGQAATALGELARERLERALSEHHHGSVVSQKPAIFPCRPGQGRDLWPSTVKVDFIATPVGISRTIAVNAQQASDVHEVETLNRRAIAEARDYVYIENQYLTSTAAADAILESLKHPDGPQIVVVLPKYECGWLERSSMGVLRGRMLRRLRSGDPYRRLHLYYPKLPGETTDSMNVHAKLILIDGRLLKVGSSNLSNRSQGLDTECDLTIDAYVSERGTTRTRRGIESVLHRLLGEHLDMSAADCAAALARGSIVELIESRRGSARSATGSSTPSGRWQPRRSCRVCFPPTCAIRSYARSVRVWRCWPRCC
jgi:phospholipase D1/2